MDSDISLYRLSARPGHQLGSLTPEGQIPFLSPILEPHKPLRMLHDRAEEVDLSRVTGGVQTPCAENIFFT